MPILYSKVHKEIVGHVDGQPFRVLFDSDGFSDEVPDEVAKQLVGNKSAKIAPEVSADLDFSKANPAQLKKWAKDHDIETGDASKKAELLAIIETAQKESENGGEHTAQSIGGGEDAPPVV